MEMEADNHSEQEIAELESEVRSAPVPKHIAIIMDGNRRFAKEFLGKPVSEGHRMGKDTLNDVVHWCHGLDIRCLTVYAFSVENFSRDPDEVEFLMEFIAENLRLSADDKQVEENRVGIRVIGDRTLLPDYVKEAVDYAETKTRDYNDFTLCIAMAYGGRQEITSAVRSIAEKAVSGEISTEDIDMDMVSSELYTGSIPDPDLIIRTSGELRVSNFILWQMAYSELYFTDVPWPTFSYYDFLLAVREYQGRKRRYGKRSHSATRPM